MVLGGSMKKIIGLALLNVYLNYQRAGYSLDSAYIECGGAAFPKGVVTVAHVTYLFIQIVVPIMLIILGMLDFGKASIAKDQNQIAKKQKVFVKRTAPIDEDAGRSPAQNSKFITPFLCKLLGKTRSLLGKICSLLSFPSKLLRKPR